MASKHRDRLRITPDHVDELVRTHMKLRNSLGHMGVAPAEHGRRDFERKHAKKDQQELGTPKEEPKEMDKAYCFGCKDKKDFEVEEVRKTKTGMDQGHGKCPDCGGKLAGHFRKKGTSKAAA